MRHVASGKSIEVSPTFERKMVLTVGDVRRALQAEVTSLTQRIMLEILQDTHSLDLCCAAVDIRFSELLCISLKTRQWQTTNATLMAYLKRVHIVGKDDDFVSPRFMVIDEELTGLILIRVHAVQKHAFP